MDLSRSVFAQAVLLAGLIAAGLPGPAQAPADGRRETVEFQSAAVARNRTGDKGKLTLHVLLPPSYAQSARRYPVVYTFHGFGDRPEDLLEAVRGPLDEAVAAGTSGEYILVGIPGTNRLGGSFYVDSAATGGWADMATREVVTLVEARYRAIPEAWARGLAGYSMGGFAAWNLALAHADRFSCAWAVCPGAFDEKGLEDAWPTWDGRIRNAYGAAFAPDPAGSPYPPYGQMPAFDDSAADRAIQNQWRAGFGDVRGKLTRYLAGSARLKGLRFDYGERDDYGWIPRGTAHVAAALKEAGLPVELQGWNAGHTFTEAMLRKGFVPFFARMFQR